MSYRPHPTRDGCYYVEYYPDGRKGGLKRLLASSLAEAVAMDRTIKEQKLKPVAPEITHPRIQDCYKEYLLWVQRNQSPATWRNKRYAFEERIVPHFGAYRVRELNQVLYDQFEAGLAGKRRAIGLYIDYLGGLINWLIERGLASPLPFKPKKPAYKLPKHTISGVQDAWHFIEHLPDDPGELLLPVLICGALPWPLADLPDWHGIGQLGTQRKAILTTILCTGLRWNECTNLRWEDVNLERREILVRESEQEDEAAVGIYNQMLPWFTANWRPRGFVFPSPGNEDAPYGSMKRSMGTAGRTSGVVLSPHDLRRTSAMVVYEATKYDLLAVQRHLRHKDIKTTMRYLEACGLRIQKARDDMEQYFAQELSKKREYVFTPNKRKTKTISRTYN